MYSTESEASTKIGNIDNNNPENKINPKYLIKQNFSKQIELQIDFPCAYKREKMSEFYLVGERFRHLQAFSSLFPDQI